MVLGQCDLLSLDSGERVDLYRNPPQNPGAAQRMAKGWPVLLNWSSIRYGKSCGAFSAAWKRLQRKNPLSTTAERKHNTIDILGIFYSLVHTFPD
ncbi:MAG: hypothetical protein C7B43_04530 [Sulfobacillus benefaciens]|jgi:hypothetical protein|uniref:Uncharacterized protein n=1 Tax=Sulfobacillus benefaciens TaxID=453960 RepID=A0A2T2X8B9_9FIRM|nr:MAG: hypothetical protein C7B43_04530 [Sulfobacillus benefaciens]